MVLNYFKPCNRFWSVESCNSWFSFPCEGWSSGRGSEGDRASVVPTQLKIVQNFKQLANKHLVKSSLTHHDIRTLQKIEISTSSVLICSLSFSLLLFVSLFGSHKLNNHEVSFISKHFSAHIFKENLFKLMYSI